MEALSVSQLNEYVRLSLASDPMLQRIRLRGEISNFKPASSGHWYFTLKDDKARIACVMFRSAAMGVRFRPADGQRVVLTGSVSLYAASGQYQFYGDAMTQEGVGALYEAYEMLKNRLQAEGLFDASLKKPLPLLPKCVGIVTSPTGAVIQDIRQVAGRRNPNVQLLLCPSAVQGTEAPDQLVRALRRLDAMEQVDVIIIGRGGGSLEELWAFNEEKVARAIFECRTPVVSAVGHETDFTIADFVADQRAPTPSAAAELTVPRLEELTETVQRLCARGEQACESLLRSLRQRVSLLQTRLEASAPLRQMEARREKQAMLCRRLELAYSGYLQRGRGTLETLDQRLDALSPARVLSRGYAMVTDRTGTPLTQVSRVSVNDRVNVCLQDGQFTAQVCERTVYNGSEKENHV